MGQNEPKKGCDGGRGVATQCYFPSHGAGAKPLTSLHGYASEGHKHILFSWHLIPVCYLQNNLILWSDVIISIILSGSLATLIKPTLSAYKIIQIFNASFTISFMNKLKRMDGRMPSWSTPHGQKI
jgi:hypothetical protein